ncbi:MAG: WD40 repeat domain-containing protein, partial [Acidimicrobiales bacterium]
TRGTLLTALETHPLLTGLLYGNESGLEATVFSPDGELLFTPTSDGTGTIVWDAATRTQIDVLAHEDDLDLDAAVSPDGRWLVIPAVAEDADGFESHLQVWDLSTRTLDHVVPSPAGLLSSAAFSADGRRLVTQGGPRMDGTYRTEAVVWDTASWTATRDTWVLDEPYVDDRVLQVSPDGERLATITSDGAVQAWTIDDRRPLGPPLQPDVGPPTTLAFAPDGTLAIAGDSSRVAIVDPESGSEQPAMRLPDGGPTAAEFSPDGTILAVGNTDGRTQLFDVASGQELGPALAASTSQINDISFSPDGARMATGSTDRTGALWRLDGGRAIADVVAGHGAPVTEVAYSADGHYLVSGGGGVVALHDMTTGSIRRIDVGGEVLTVAVDPTDTWVAAAGTTGKVQLYDLRNGDPGPRLDLGDAWIYQVAFDSTSGALAAAVQAQPDDPASNADYAVVWDPRAGREIGPRIPLPGGYGLGVAWSPDGEQLAVITENNLVYLFDADGEHGQLGLPLESVDAPFLAVAFSPDSSRLVTGTTSGVVQQWSATTHQPLGPALEGHTGPVGGVAYSPDGTTLVATTVGFSRSRLWQAETGSAIGEELIGARTPVTYTGFELTHYQGSRPAFTPDGRSVATPAYDGTVAVWDLDPGHWLEAACGLVGRDLSPEEWDQYMGELPHRSTCD